MTWQYGISLHNQCAKKGMFDSPGQKLKFFIQTQVLLIYRFISYFNIKLTKLTFTQMMMSTLTIT